MAIELEIARLSKILVDAEGIHFEEAQQRLRALTLEIVVGDGVVSSAAHAAVLTAVSLGRRTFLGGVRVLGDLDQNLNSVLPIEAMTLRSAVNKLGVSDFPGEPRHRILIGASKVRSRAIATHWDGWTAGVHDPCAPQKSGDGSNPLAGIVAGAMAVGHAFNRVRGVEAVLPVDFSIWGLPDPPAFHEVFLPSSLWLVGLGNLGQAFVWALASLPYAEPAKVDIVLQDADRIDPENWGTSVLVQDGNYGMLKTFLAEQWLARSGFRIRRIDRNMLASDQVRDDEPRLALWGLDRIAVRRELDGVGFDAIVDAGLGRKANDFDMFRVTVFHGGRSLESYFAGMGDPGPALVPDMVAYQALAAVDPCGAAKIAGASVAVPHVSAIAACVAIARSIALTSNISFPVSTAQRIGDGQPRRMIPAERADARRLSHAGRPLMTVLPPLERPAGQALVEPSVDC